MSVRIFDTGQREQVDERTTWHGHGWYDPDDDLLRIPVGPETVFTVGPDGHTTVYHDGQRGW